MTRPHYKHIAEAYKAQSHMLLRRAVAAERELVQIPKLIRWVCRVANKLVKITHLQIDSCRKACNGVFTKTSSDLTE